MKKRKDVLIEMSLRLIQNAFAFSLKHLYVLLGTFKRLGWNVKAFLCLVLILKGIVKVFCE